MGGMAGLGLGGGIQTLLQVMGAGNAANTALNAAALAQQFQNQEQNTVLQMGLAQFENEQLQNSMIGQSISTVFELQQKNQETFFKTGKKIAENWVAALGSGGGGR